MQNLFWFFHVIEAKKQAQAFFRRRSKKTIRINNSSPRPTPAKQTHWMAPRAELIKVTAVGVAARTVCLAPGTTAVGVELGFVSSDTVVGLGVLVSVAVTATGMHGTVGVKVGALVAVPVVELVGVTAGVSVGALVGVFVWVGSPITVGVQVMVGALGVTATPVGVLVSSAGADVARLVAVGEGLRVGTDCGSRPAWTERMLATSPQTIPTSTIIAAILRDRVILPPRESYLTD